MASSIALWGSMSNGSWGKASGVVYRRKRFGLWLAALAGALGLRCGDAAQGGDVLDEACAVADARLRECGALTGDGYHCASLQPRPIKLQELACRFQCYSDAAECSVVRDIACGDFRFVSADADDYRSECETECARQFGVSCERSNGTLGYVSSMLWCDGTNDCADGLDEAGCDRFECGDGQVVDRSVVCDGFFNCDNRYDEGNSCRSFSCGDGLRLAFEQVCNGARECADGSDEQGCSPDERFALDCVCGLPDRPACPTP